MLLPLLLIAALATPLAAAPADDAIDEALAALARGDGVAAELAGKRAVNQGAAPARVAALIGEGELLQGDLADARQWLGPGLFDPASSDRGWYALARLELASGDLDAAAQAFDQILSRGPGWAGLWVDIGRMRYRAGEHSAARQAAERALELDARDPRALEFMAQLRRDAEGLAAALPLLREAVEQVPADKTLQAELAATLGDSGHHAEMLAVVRAMVEADPEQPRAYYLQAVLAARAGQDVLAKRLWWQTRGAMDRSPAGMLVQGVLEYRTGNPALAVEHFAALSRAQPFNETARLLLARALVANGEGNAAVPILLPLADRDDASAYTVVLLARAYEQMGEREKAATYLDRQTAMGLSAGAFQAALPVRDNEGLERFPDDPVQQLRTLAADGRLGEARRQLAGFLTRYEGSIDLQLLAGDAALLDGDPATALELYRGAGEMRTNWPLLQRVVAAMTATGKSAEAQRELAAYVSENPRDTAALAYLGRSYLQQGKARRAATLLDNAARIGAGPFDAQLLADLALAQQAAGEQQAALRSARAAHALNRSNRRVAGVLGRVMAMQGDAGTASQALLAKAGSSATNTD